MMHRFVARAAGQIGRTVPSIRGSSTAASGRPCHREHARFPRAFTGGVLLYTGVMMHSAPSKSCLMEASPPAGGPRRRRPPTFGAQVPSITTRGFTTRGDAGTTRPAVDDREDCPMCKKFSRGPCGQVFKRWLACTDKHPGKDASGEPLHLNKCLDFAEQLAECLDANEEYYSKEESDESTSISDRGSQNETELKDAWRGFVDEVEAGISSSKYGILSFPDDIRPKVQVRLESRSGAAFFARETEDGRSIIAAYILDDSGSVIAAGSKEDMDMGGLGFVLQFKVADGMKSATFRAIYDTDNDDDIAVFARTMLIPAGR